MHSPVYSSTQATCHASGSSCTESTLSPTCPQASSPPPSVKHRCTAPRKNFLPWKLLGLKRVSSICRHTSVPPAALLSILQPRECASTVRSKRRRSFCKRSGSALATDGEISGSCGFTFASILLRRVRCIGFAGCRGGRRRLDLVMLVVSTMLFNRTRTLIGKERLNQAHIICL
jgi:hypothetical protein